jgi:ferrous iron transport protein B
MSTIAKPVTIAVAGNPNCGKTTIFNGLTGGRQKIGNWPGVTIERKEGRLDLGPIQEALARPFMSEGRPLPQERKARVAGEPGRLVDLPGIYSLSASSEDEIVARDYILSGEPDVVVDIVDAANLERNLYLTTQLLEMGVPLLVVLNMTDVAEDKNITIDADRLSAQLACPVVAVVGTRKSGIEAIRSALADVLRMKELSPVRPAYPKPVEEAIGSVTPRIAGLAQHLGATERWVAVKLIEGDPWVSRRAVDEGVMSHQDILALRGAVKQALSEEPDVVLADGRYRFIMDVVASSVTRGAAKPSASDAADRVLMHRVFGIPIFLVAMYGVFWATITIGGSFIDFFDILFGTIFVDGFGVVLSSIGSPNWLVTILAGGVGAGIQTVATFIPIIFFMFLMLSILEDSGYMARAAFVMDRFMRWIGLPGKSFVPMLLGFGCTIPAIMGTRTLETRKDRFMTIFMSPFMSCGARLPVYALFAAALFPTFAGAVVFSIYIVGIVMAVLTGLLLKRTLFAGEVSHFVMELPPYHAPRIRHILTGAWFRLRAFVRRAGIVIVTVVAVLGFLNSLGTRDGDWTFGNENTGRSVLAAIGKNITPVFAPMGVAQENWPATVGLFTGIFAKEAVVGTLSSLYSQQLAAEQSATGPEAAEEGGEFDFWVGIGEAFASIPANLVGIFGGLADPLGTSIVSGDEATASQELETPTTVFAMMRSHFTGASAYAYLLFVLIYSPCVAALGVAIKEMGSGLGWFLAGYLTVAAWIVATLVYQFASGPSLVWILIPLALLAGILVLFRYIGGRMSKATVAE